jgi:hypothetical protein
MEALTTGVIEPTTAEQRHFLQVARGEAAPETPFEKAWAKLCYYQDASSGNEPPSSAAPQPLLGVAASSSSGESSAAPAAKQEEESKFDQLAEARDYLDGLRKHMESEREEVLAQVRSELEAIEARYAQQLQEASAAVAELELEVKAEVLRQGQSVRVGDVHAVFYRGRVTWDSKGLAGYALSHPELEKFRRVGAPMVILRYKGPPKP